MNKDWPVIDTSELNQEALKEFEENERVIKRLLRIPKKKITDNENEELRYRVWNRANIVRRFREK